MKVKVLNPGALNIKEICNPPSGDGGKIKEYE